MRAMTSLLDDVFEARPAGDAPLLRVNEMSVTFGGLRAVQSVSFDVGQHDLVCIIGPNGAGKSSTLNAISRLVPAQGVIEFDRRDVLGVPSWRAASWGIGRSFQDPVLVEHLSVIENVLIGAHHELRYRLVHQLIAPRRVQRLEAPLRARARRLLDFFELSDVADKAAGSLPYGARKLVDIARAMVSGPKLLLLDEPSSGVDRHERAILQRTLTTLRDRGLMALLVVEHHMDLVRAISSHVVVLEAGSVALAGPAHDVLGSDTARRALAGGGAPGSHTQSAADH